MDGERVGVERGGKEEGPDYEVAGSLYLPALAGWRCLVIVKRVIPALVLSLLPLSGWAGDGALRVDSGVEVPKVWRADQHVYVNGNIGVADPALAGLEKWIDGNAPNWTIVLLETGRGESYTDARGLSYSGIDAVEHALGKELPNKTPFGGIEHPETGEAYGAFFVLFLKDRTFSYYGSDVFDRRGLGDRNWAGGLDGPAKRAMRSGGRVVDAARDTIKEVEKKLESKLRNEKRQREEAKLRAERRKAQVGEEIHETGTALAGLESEVEALRENPALAEGDLALPELAKWKADAGSAAQALAAGHVDAAERLNGEVRRAVDAHRRAIRQFRQDAVAIAELGERLKVAKVHPANRLGAKFLKDGQEAHRLASEQHAKGMSGYQQHMVAARRSLDTLESDNRAMVAKLQREERQAAERKRMIQTATRVAGGIVLLILAGFGIAGNRGRRKVKALALKALDLRREEMLETVDRLFALMDRAGVVVGPEAELPKRGYEGETLAESKRAIRGVDRAFVLSSNVRQIIDQASGLIHPGNPFSRLRNFVSRGRYEKAADMLDATVLLDAQPPPLPGAEKHGVGKRLGDADEGDVEVELSGWKERMEGAMDESDEALDRVEQAWLNIVPRRRGLAEEIEALEDRQAAVQGPAAEDGWFRLVPVFDQWLPVMNDELEHGLKLGRNDPVAALDGPIASGERMAGEARELVEAVCRFREQEWGNLLRAEASLDGFGRATLWIDRALDRLSGRADELAVAGTNRPVAEELGKLGEGMLAFARQAGDAAVLAERSESELLPAISAGEETVQAARDELGRALRVPAEQVLCEEEGLDPSRFLAKAREQRQAAGGSLDQGETAGARRFLTEVDELLAEAAGIVEATREAFETHDAEKAALVAGRQQLIGRAEAAGMVVEELRRSYAPPALAEVPRDGESGSLAEAPGRLADWIEDAGQLVNSAAKAFAIARLLEARMLLGEGSGVVAGGEELCSAVDARKADLLDLVGWNGRRLGDASRRNVDLQAAAGDRRVTRRTLEVQAGATAMLGEARIAVEADASSLDPYRGSDLLDELEQASDAVEQAIAADHEAHASAMKTLEAVRASEREAASLAGTAEADQIPDSQETTLSLDELRRQQSELASLAVRLEEDHADWRELEQRLVAVHRALGQLSANLRQELERARQAVEAIARAEVEVSRANIWSGGHGVSISGNRGALAEAGRALVAGGYADVLRHAGFAAASARQAIATAEAEVARRRRAAAAAAAAAARRARRSSFSSSSRSSFSSGSSFGSSSSVGRSSFSSGSGVGRSGW